MAEKAEKYAKTEGTKAEMLKFLQARAQIQFFRVF